MESWLTTAETHEMKPPWEQVLGQETGTVIDKLLNAQFGQRWELNTQGVPVIGGLQQYCEIYL